MSDRDKVFLSAFWYELFNQTITKLNFSGAYRPQNDGHTKVVNICLEAYLRCLIRNKSKQWPKWLSWVEYWYNTNYH